MANTATMLDYEYHYPLTPIQSASHNIHPAFRNDPELADIMNVNGSTTTLVPPPRNPLRTAVKPLFSSSEKEVNSSSLSLAQTLEEKNHSTLTLNAPEPVAADSPISPLSPASFNAHTASSQASYQEVHDSTPLPPHEKSNKSELALHTSEPVSPLSSLPLQGTPPTSTFTARTLSSLPCPPSLFPQEWSFFLRDLQNAAALSKTQKTIAVAVALAVPVGCPITRGLLMWGVWRYQTIKNVRRGLEDGAAFEKKRGKESVESVVERWNEKWQEMGVRVNLEVRTKEKKARGEKGRLRVVVSELKAPKPTDEGYESEDDMDLEKAF